MLLPRVEITREKSSPAPGSVERKKDETKVPSPLCFPLSHPPSSTLEYTPIKPQEKLQESQNPPG